MKIKMEAGNFFDIELPSGKVLQVEVTQDTASVCVADRVLFSEEFDYHRLIGDAEWVETWPKPEATLETWAENDALGRYYALQREMDPKS